MKPYFENLWYDDPAFILFGFKWYKEDTAFCICNFVFGFEKVK